MQQKKRRKRVVLATPPQLMLLDGPEPPVVADRADVRFMRFDPRDVYLGAARLDEHLKSVKMGWVIDCQAFLAAMDWTGFEAAYQGGGRPAYPPGRMVGLLMYGMACGVSSLRGMERSARTDLCAMWFAGGAAPDHSVIGRFIVQHKERLTGEFFEDLTRRVLKHLGSRASDLNVDGTVVQAAASRYRRLTAEAAAAARDEAIQAAETARRSGEAEEVKAAEECVEKAVEVAAVAQERTDARRAHGRTSATATVAPSEPEAVTQKLKEGGVAASYKPSVVVNEDRIIVGQAVDPSSENRVVPEMLAQAERISGEPTKRLAADAGYHADALINHAIEHNIDFLCPEGKVAADGSTAKKSEKQLLKNRFTYDESTDTYRCPQRHKMTRCETYAGNATNPGYVRYKTDACKDCPLRSRCCGAKTDRKIKRFHGDEAKEALRSVMQQPAAKKRYGKRKTTVEPVFSALKTQQCLRRFRRRGLQCVRLEFSLHASAHNLRRMVEVDARRARRARTGEGLRGPGFALGQPTGARPGRSRHPRSASALGHRASWSFRRASSWSATRVPGPYSWPMRGTR